MNACKNEKPHLYVCWPAGQSHPPEIYFSEACDFYVDGTYPIWLTPAKALCDYVVKVIRLIVIYVGNLLFIQEWLLTSTRVSPIGAIRIVPGCGKCRDVQCRTWKSCIILRPG